MRLHVLSDLHLKYAPFAVPRIAADVVVLAGDINRGSAGVAWAREQFPDRTVLYVLGNHEFYRGTVADVRVACQRQAALAGGRVHVLDDGEWVAGNVAFLGTTLWTDFGLFGDASKPDVINTIREAVRDFRLIRVVDPDGKGRALQPEDTLAAFTRSLTWLKARMHHHRALGHKLCVVTHFAPSRGSLADRHRDDPVSAYFVNALDAWLETEGPDLWIHGHTHDGFDYHVGRTRVLCNARGYPGEREVPATLPFDPELTVDI